MSLLAAALGGRRAATATTTTMATTTMTTASAVAAAVVARRRQSSWTRPKHGFVDAVGNTPLVRIESLSRACGRNIYAKAEWMNPGGSVKDRAAVAIIEEHERAGRLVPGSSGGTATLVEGTAGNTGIGMAHVCLARGYRCIIYMPDTQSDEKMAALRTLGADVRAVAAVPYADPRMYQHQAREEAARLGAAWGNQFDNTANRRAHTTTTAPEIDAQLGGRVDAFTCATGTGGTLAGVSDYLRAHVPAAQIVLADPAGSALHAYVKTGAPERHDGTSITEGIGNGRVTDNLAGAHLDDAVRVLDDRVVATLFRLLADDGLFVGASSALNAAAAVAVAERLPRDANVVTVLCDTAQRYQSRLFSRAWLESKGLYDCVPDDCRHLVSLP